jgi:hypothetical protein
VAILGTSTTSLVTCAVSLDLCIVASLLRIFRIRSLRASLFFLTMTVAVHCGLEIGYILAHSRVGLKLINQYPSPLELQVPTLIYFSTRRCAWVDFAEVLQ